MPKNNTKQGMLRKSPHLGSLQCETHIQNTQAQKYLKDQCAHHMVTVKIKYFHTAPPT